MKTILATIDTSRTANAVVAEAAALARPAGARMVLLTIVQPPIITSEYTPIIENIAELAAAGEKAAARHLATIASRLHARGLRTTSVRVSGAPVPHIIAQAKKHRADYIVMGSHGHTAFYDLLVGSTTHGVLMRAPCPVVIVPPKSRKARNAKR